MHLPARHFLKLTVNSGWSTIMLSQTLDGVIYYDVAALDYLVGLNVNVHKLIRRHPIEQQQSNRSDDTDGYKGGDNVLPCFTHGTTP